MADTTVSRREALLMAAGAGVSLAAANFAVAGVEPTKRAVRVGVVGTGARGSYLLHRLLSFDGVSVPAVCDVDEKALARARSIVEKAGGRVDTYGKDADDYRRMLARTDLDAVIIATPHADHARQSIAAMEAGKFVGAEVPACCTVEECREMARVGKSTGTGYMLLENYCYGRPVMMVGEMAGRGVLGELTYGFGAYVHETRSMRFDEDGKLTWRGENSLKLPGNVYPTHAIGPVAGWMGIGKTDRLKSVVAMSCQAISNHLYAERTFGSSSPQAQLEFKNGDTTQCLIQTEKGRLIELRYDTASPRPHGMGCYALQGTKGAYESALGQRMMYVEGRSKRDAWEPLDSYAGEFDHASWREKAEAAKGWGHGGADYFVLADFLRAVRTGESAIPLSDALAWSVIRPLSAESVVNGSRPVAIPDFAV